MAGERESARASERDTLQRNRPHKAGQSWHQPKPSAGISQNHQHKRARTCTRASTGHPPVLKFYSQVHSPVLISHSPVLIPSPHAYAELKITMVRSAAHAQPLTPTLSLMHAQNNHSHPPSLMQVQITTTKRKQEATESGGWCVCVWGGGDTCWAPIVSMASTMVRKASGVMTLRAKSARTKASAYSCKE